MLAEQRGLEKGVARGRHEERLRIARALLDVIADDALIAEKTSLLPDQVQRLRAEKQVKA